MCACIVGRNRREFENHERKVSELPIFFLSSTDSTHASMMGRFSTLNDQQELTIKNLKLEIEEIQEELASADVLDEAVCSEHLSTSLSVSQS